MKSVNRVTLIGTAGKNAEAKYTSGGTAVTKLSLATNEKYKDKSGSWQERTEWHNLVLWSKLAEIASQYVKKGSRVYVEGRLQTSKWRDKKTGQDKYQTEIVVDELILLDSVRKQDNEAASSAQEVADEDIPF